VTSNFAVYVECDQKAESRSKSQFWTHIFFKLNWGISKQSGHSPSCGQPADPLLHEDPPMDFIGVNFMVPFLSQKKSFKVSCLRHQKFRFLM